MTDFDEVQKRLESLEQVMREAFQAGQQFQKMLDGAVPLNEGPPNEDAYVRGVKKNILMKMVVQMGESALAYHHSALADSLLRQEAEASTRLDGETHVVEDTNG